MEKDVLTVSALTKYIKLKFDKDRYLIDVPLKAEIAELKARRGNYYMQLKDAHALISGVLFAEYVTPAVQHLAVGSEVIVVGDVSVYEKTGTYQLYIHEVALSGQGDLYLAFEKLKQKLFASGYFDSQHKKQIPPMPKSVILITAPGSAALHDMLVTLQKRYPLVSLSVLTAAVQGEKAVNELIAQLKVAEAMQADVIILARGGGSYEDLQAFNDERLALTIFALQTPVVTGIGHEIDVTIADLVADMRAATPTAAIERITPDIADLFVLLETYRNRLAQSFARVLERKKQVIVDLKQQLSKAYLYDKIIEQRQQILADAQRRLVVVMSHKLIQARELLKHKETHLEALSPFDILLRGYSITRQSGNVITSIKQVTQQKEIDVLLSDGTLICDVKEIKDDKEKRII